MKMKKSISLLLVFTLILTLFSTLSVILPSATDGESTESTETTSYNTKVAHIARGAATKNTTLRYVYFNIAAAEDIVAGDTYTVKMRYVGSPSMSGTANNRYLAIRQGEKGSGAECLAICTTGTSLSCTNYGTLETRYNFKEWTVDVIPTAAKMLSVCVYMAGSQSTADFYIGGITVLDKDGNDIAIALSESTDFYNNSSPTNVNWYGKADASTPTTNYFETCEVIDIDNVEDADLKQDLVNAYYEGDSMLNFTPGTSPTSHAVYKKFPADKLTAGTKYKLSIKYSAEGITFGDSAYFLIRNNTTAVDDTDSSIELSSADSTTGYFNHHRNYSEYIDYYTVPETATDTGTEEGTETETETETETATPTYLYIGIYLSSSNWTNANLTIGEIKFTDVNGNTVEIPLSDMGELYRSNLDGVINQLLSDDTQVACQKQQLDNALFANIATGQKQVVNVDKYSTSTSSACRVFVRVPGLLPGDYEVSYKTNGLNHTKTTSSEARHFEVYTRIPDGTQPSEKPTLETISQPSIDEMTYSFSLTTEDFVDVYVGFYVHYKNPLMDYFIENLTLTKMDGDVAGENLIDPDLYIPTWYRRNNSNGYSDDGVTPADTWTKIALVDNTKTYNSVFRITLMDDEDESYTSRFASQHVNIKIQGINQGYAKKADGLEAGTYKVTCILHGADIKTKGYPYFILKYDNGDALKMVSTENKDIRADSNIVNKVEGTNATYKFTYEFTLEEGSDTVYAGIYTTDSVDMNVYITELSLVKVENGVASDTNLFTSLKTRDWYDSVNRTFCNDYATYYNAASRKIISRDTTVADVNEDEATNIVDLLILSKLQDAGIELVDGTNDLAIVRSTILTPTTE